MIQRKVQNAFLNKKVFSPVLNESSVCADLEYEGEFKQATEELFLSLARRWYSFLKKCHFYKPCIAWCPLRFYLSPYVQTSIVHLVRVMRSNLSIFWTNFLIQLIEKVCPNFGLLLPTAVQVSFPPLHGLKRPSRRCTSCVTHFFMVVILSALCTHYYVGQNTASRQDRNRVHFQNILGTHLPLAISNIGEIDTSARGKGF